MSVIPRPIPSDHFYCEDCRQHALNPDDLVHLPGCRCAPMATTAPQPPPRLSLYPAVWPLVIDDMRRRDEQGRQKYGGPLQPYNGRDALTDAYQEALDLAVYLRQALYERDGH